ncbi:ImmA/IrrE family metallo-endopeptidase [Minwuia thermotolerans]|uniref:IrrE N-terminal-like domain-containing protein n=1 Tax=Minwuia thermotolerans TaxID=2056226 RepID=A0A2M9G559_9PROT|nr:ImmA/IrrE family metallo-endopeptidase [Minwuia thermotolerans]PJK30853.1 hypothetical protein CVT23_04700 [Minwuia thermotolerans]
MELDDAGLNPERIAAAIHDQLGEAGGAVPVQDIARRLDITEIREMSFNGVEGVLITTPERPDGMIAVNARSSAKRRRFTLAHELGHFLMTHHRMVGRDGFRCSRSDMLARVEPGDAATAGLHLGQEAEANRFAIELLAPARRLKRYLHRPPDLARVLEISDAFEISREAAARRYVEQHRDNLAVLFGHHGRIIYLQKARGFPWITRAAAIRCPACPTELPGSRRWSRPTRPTGSTGRPASSSAPRSCASATTASSSCSMPR